MKFVALAAVAFAMSIQPLGAAPGGTHGFAASCDLLTRHSAVFPRTT